VASGEFISIEDFFKSVNSHIVNRKTIESLVKTGAFDRFSSRSLLLNNIESLLAFSQKKQKEQDSGQTDLFGNAIETDATSKINLGPEDVIYNTKDYLTWERELMGLYLSAHPLTDYKELLAEQVHPIGDLNEKHDGKKTKIGGLVTDVRVIQTKNGQNMAFVKVADLISEIELILFPRTYEETSWLWVVDKVLIIEGEVNAKDRDGNIVSEVKINVNSAREVPHEEAINYVRGSKKPIKSIDEVKPKKATKTKEKTASSIKKRIYIRMLNTEDSERLNALKDHLKNNPGDVEVVLVVGPSESKQAIKIPDKTSLSDESISTLISLFDKDNVVVS
jgi:DNA polymerase-3 subunit alpha